MLCCKRVRISPAKTMETQGGVPRILEFVDFSNSASGPEGSDAFWSIFQLKPLRISPAKTMETQGGVPRIWEFVDF